MEKMECPLCGCEMDSNEHAAVDRGTKADAPFASYRCEECGLNFSIKKERLGELRTALGSQGGRPTVQSIQRQEGLDDTGVPVKSNQAIVTTDGPVLEALVDLSKIEEMFPGRSPLGALEDCARITVRKAGGAS